MHCTSRSLLRTAFNTVLRGPSATPPAFLLPFAVPQTTPFSTTATLNGKRNPRKKGHRDGNPARGTSALRRTGLKKQYLSVKLENLPKPVLDRREHTEVEVDPDHGLWGFFTDEKEALQVPTAVVAHGRAWTVPELRRKDWEELHRLWWKCVREINRYRTMETERQRVKAGYGEYEVDVRLDTVSLDLSSRWMRL